jgi:co-chaperonin GroES (HSP10)
MNDAVRGFGTGAFAPARALTNEEERIVEEAGVDGNSDDNWENLEDTKVPEDLQADLNSGDASVLYWRALIMPVRPQKKSRGGILLVEESRENAQYLTYIGKIVALGPLWCKGANFQTDSPLEFLPKLKPGDWVLYGRHAGQRVEYKGVKFLLVNDDDKLMKIRSPEGWRIYT